MLLLEMLIGILIVVVVILCIKIHFLHRAMEEMEAGFGERIAQDTNTLITISSGDRVARRLAGQLNDQLRLLRQERRRLQSGDRELKEAVTNISHDLRTPLTAICGYLDLLKGEEKSNTAKRYLSMIENRTEAMKMLTEELFHYSVITFEEEQMEYEEVVLNRVLEESISAYYGAFKKAGITPEIKMTEKKILRSLDKKTLQRILGNVISNGIKYSGGDFQIELTDYGEMNFTNTAPCLNAVQVGRLFQRFYTVAAARQSTGLGLSIAKNLTEKMGGKITAEYQNGRLCIKILLKSDKESPRIHLEGSWDFGVSGRFRKRGFLKCIQHLFQIFGIGRSNLLSIILPFCISRTVGIVIMRNCFASSGSSSTFTLPIFRSGVS